MPCGDKLPWCTSYPVWAYMIEQLIKYDFYGYSLLWTRSHHDVLFSESQWVSVATDYKRSLIPSFTRYSSPFGFVCFGTSTAFNAWWRLLRIALNVTRNKHMITLFPDATYSLARSTTEDDKHLTITSGWCVREQIFTLQKCPKGMMGASWKLTG